MAPNTPNTCQPGIESQLAVLVVETEPHLAAGLARISFLGEGMAVFMAATWSEAFGRLQERRYDILLVDVDDMDWPTLRELAALRRASSGALLIALTAEPDLEVYRVCRAQGADRVLSFQDALSSLYRGLGVG